MRVNGQPLDRCPGCPLPVQTGQPYMDVNQLGDLHHSGVFTCNIYYLFIRYYLGI